jgi:DtxR family Mn-dependent transcriptional regulator
VSLTASLEDYLEAILRLSRLRRVVRVRDIAKAVGVRPPSATGAIQQLKQRGLVTHEKYEEVLLTERGEALAEGVHQRHEELRSFFADVLRLDSATAEREACALEHSISGLTLERLGRFLACVKECSAELGGLEAFRRYIETGKGHPGVQP